MGFICFNVENQKPVGRGVFEKKKKHRLRGKEKEAKHQNLAES
jgi:hypothetical protein